MLAIRDTTMRTRRRVAAAPDFYLSNSTVVTAWGPVVVGQLIPIGYTSDEVEFEIVEDSNLVAEYAGLAVAGA